MKNLLLIIGLFLTLTSCEKQFQKDESPIDVTNTMIETRASGSSIEVQCVGGCGDDNQCVMDWDLKNGKVSCRCADNCKMVLSNSEVPPLSGSVNASIKDVAEYFINSRQSDIGIMSIELKIDVENLTEFVYFVFEENSNVESVGYLIKYTDNKDGTYSRASKDGTEVDCSGSCKTSSDICTEEYLTTTGVVRCSCEGDGCKMTITQVKLQQSEIGPIGG